MLYYNQKRGKKEKERNRKMYYDDCNYKGNKNNLTERTENGKSRWWTENACGSAEPYTTSIDKIFDAYNEYKMSLEW
jgi:hypothetical protein